MEENLSLALKLHAQLETACPGITRPLQLRGQRFNEDLSPGGLLIEVGAAGNSHDEALTAAGELTKAIMHWRRALSRWMKNKSTAQICWVVVKQRMERIGKDTLHSCARPPLP